MMRWLSIVLAICFVSGVAAKKKGPFSRFTETISDATTSATAPSSTIPTADDTNTSKTNSTKSSRKGAFSASEKVQYLQNITKNGVDPLDILTKTATGEGMKVLLKHAEVQHRILEEMPLLAAFPGFRNVMGRRLSDEQTSAGFAQGIQEALEFAKDAFVKIKDPTQTAQTLAKMAQSDDPHTQDLFRRAQDGDKDAVFALQDLFNEEHFPGVDASVLRDVAANHNFDKLLNMPEVMRFIDRDETLSNVFRNPIDFTAGMNGDGSATTSFGGARKRKMG